MNNVVEANFDFVWQNLSYFRAAFLRSRGSGMKPKVRARAAELRGRAHDFFKIKIWNIFFLHLLGLISDKSSVE